MGINCLATLGDRKLSAGGGLLRQLRKGGGRKPGWA